MSGGHLAGSILRLRYKVKLVNAALGKQILFTAKTVRNTQIRCVGRKQNSSVLNHVVTLVITKI
jgi:hypothetical protein